MNKKINWYIDRLKTMSASELSYRFNQKYKSTYDYMFSANLLYKNIQFDYNKIPINTLNSSIRNKFDRKFNFFNMDIDLLSDINWHKDYSNNRIFPKIFSKKINIRNDELGNAKFVWEVNRLQFLPNLLLEYINTNDSKYLELFIDIMTSWHNNNPYLIGINWHSNIEINLRLITWYWCWNILDIDKELKINNNFKKFVFDIWIPLIYMHCKYSFRYPSKFSSGNNHLISEYAGLFIATSVWKFNESKKWNSYAKKGLEKEIHFQHSNNGINKEKASKYIPFILDFFLLSYIVGENTNNSFSLEYKQKLKYIFDYIYQFTDKNFNDPSYGDQDDGFCFLLDYDSNMNNFRSLLISGAILFNESNYKTKAGKIDFKNLLLFGDIGREKYDSIVLKDLECESQFYPDEGHFISKTSVGGKEIYVNFNASKLGFLSIAAHGHSDALSFVLHFDGYPILIDSGTYTYHSAPDWRNYFIGTLSHNTIRIDRKNQATIKGPTMWLNHYKTKILKFSKTKSLDFVSASHDGYIKSGVQHRRDMTFYKDELKIEFNDEITIRDDNNHFIEMPFHFHPDIILKEKSKNTFVAELENEVRLEFELDNNLDCKIILGSENPIIGWYSPKFNHKIQCPVIYCKNEANKSFNMRTKININVIEKTRK